MVLWIWHIKKTTKTPGVYNKTVDTIAAIMLLGIGVNVHIGMLITRFVLLKSYKLLWINTKCFVKQIIRNLNPN